MPSPETIYTTCTRDCPNTCGLAAKTAGGRLVGLSGSPDHPFTRGKTCVKAAMYVDRVYSPERITHPLIRRNGEWERASWDETLDLVADRIRTIRAKDGPEAILYYQGYGQRTALKLLNSLFFNLCGGVTTLRGSLCGGTGQASQNLDFGVRVSHDPLDHYNSASMILWGRNPVSTNISLVPVIRDIRKRGGTVILVDPYRNRSAALADRHIAPAPGRDAFPAMAAAKILFEHGAEDRRFLSQNATGAKAFKAVLDRFTVSELCALADVPEKDVVFLAETLMKQRPTSILLGWGMHRHANAHFSIRAIDALGAISGNIGVPGGGVSQGFEEYGPYDQRYWGTDLNPERRTLLMPRIGEEILAADNPKIRMIMTTAANPVCMAPNTAKVAEAFDAVEFKVYSGHFMDDTAARADVFLPATTFLEEQDVMASFGHNYVGPVNKAIDPVGECRSEFHMFCGLAERFSFADRFVRGVDEWLHDICAPIRARGCSMEDLKKGPFRMDAPMVPYADGRFSTPSGKFRFMTKFDANALLREDPEHPYRLLTIAPHKYICSERTMAEHEPLPTVFIHPDEAAACGLENGVPALLKNAEGVLKVLLRTDKRVRRDCVVAERGGWNKAGHGLNALTTDMASVVGNGTPYYETTVAALPCPPDLENCHVAV